MYSFWISDSEEIILYDAKEALFLAAKNDNSLVILQLHQEGVDLNATDDEGKTAVFYANENRSTNALCKLIKCDANFQLDDIDDEYAKEVLFKAVEMDSSHVIRQLHLKGLDLDATNDEGKTVVFYANENKKTNALYELIQCGANFQFDDIYDDCANEVLFKAAKMDSGDVILQLYFEDFDLNAIDHEGKTAVFYSNENGSINALYELIRCEASFEWLDINDDCAKEVLFKAAKMDSDRVISELYLRDFDLDASDDEGKTAVFYANKKRSTNALCNLISCGAKFKLDEIDAKAVLFFAAKNDKRNIVKPLYDAGLNLNLTDDEGKTVVFHCEEHFLDDLTTFDDEVLINARDPFGRTPLFYAVGYGKLKKARCLIKKGANLQLKDYCNVSIFSFCIQLYIAKNVVVYYSPLPALPLFKERHKELIIATIDIVFCKSPLLLGSIPLPHLDGNFDKEGILKALALGRDKFLVHDVGKVDIVKMIISRIKEKKVDVPLVMSLLNKLDPDPNAADLNGNTAVHYAALLPFCGVEQKDVMNIFKILRKFGSTFSLKNQRHESPLQLCLSPKLWKAAIKGNNWQSSFEGLDVICKFLLSNGCGVTFTSQNAESTFHTIISIIQECLDVTEDEPRKDALSVLTKILISFSPNEAVRVAVNSPDSLSNSPLHLWATIALKSSKSYASLEDTFKNILQIIFDHLLKCGANVNLRNCNGETPLHMCRTWTAVKMLLHAGANPKDADASGSSPLICAAKKVYSNGTDCFYPDVREDQETFWKSALQKGLDPWVVDKRGQSILNILMKSNSFLLARALVKTACEDNHATSETKLSFLNAICTDECKYTHWKSTLVDLILKSTTTERLHVESPFRLCCENVVKFGLFNDNLSSIQQNGNKGTSYDDGQRPPKKQETRESGKDNEHKEKASEYDYSVHGRIANQLLLYGADIHLGDSDGVSCLDIADSCPLLKDLLRKPIEIESLPILIPWTSTSHKCSGKLAKVARGQECRKIDQILYHEGHIGNGSFGSIFAGINSKDGREVAVKRAEKLRMQRAEDRREIQNLIALADCEQVVCYISFFEDDDFSYIVLELMDGNLEEYLKEFTMDPTQASNLCNDVIMGLEFLHKQNILHRDLKPRNILYKERPKPCLKIADFGLSRKADSKSTTVYVTGVGTRCWIAPEVLTSKTNSVNSDRFERQSDIFSCGLILHYIASGRKHPFRPTDCSNKSETEICNETESNVMKGKIEGLDVSLSPEASHLIRGMLESNPKNRPSAAEALEHPLFWCGQKKMDFLQAVGNQKEFESPRSGKTNKKRKTTQKTTTDETEAVKTNLEKCFHDIVENGNWINASGKYTTSILGETIKGWNINSYEGKSVVELLRFIRNVYQHYNDRPSTLPIEQWLFRDCVFLKDFPSLVMKVYQVITTHGWDNSRDNIKNVLNRK